MKKNYLFIIVLFISLSSYSQCAFTFSITPVNISCNGLCDGSASVVVIGGTGPFTYSWSSGGATGDSISGLCNGTFKCIVEESGCKDSAYFDIVEPSQLNILASSSDASCAGKCDGIITATTTGGMPGYSYTYSPGGTSVNLCAGNYTAYVTDTNGCEDSSLVTVGEPDSLKISITKTDITCYSGSNGTATAIVSGGTPAYNYSWNTNPMESAPTAFNLGPDTFQVTVVDDLGCRDSASIVIYEPSQIIISTISTTSVTCYGGSDGAASMSATGGVPAQSGYIYSWSPGLYSTPSISGIPAALYAFSVKDSLNCVVTKTVDVSGPSPFIADAQQLNACGGAGGEATVNITGGMPGYSYLWNPGGETDQSISGLSAGTYTITLTDSRSCTATDTLTITLYPPIVPLATVTNVNCNAGNDGAISLALTGGTPGFTFQWSSGDTTQNVSGLTMGTYTVIITDSVACQKTEVMNVSEPAALSLSFSQVNSSCAGNSDGSALVTPTGGTPGYNFSWNNGQTTATATGLSAGTITCLVTDTNSCPVTDSVIIINNPSMVISPSVNHVLCNGESNGSIFVNVSGGSPPYSYSWIPANTTDNISGLSAGTYTFSVTDGMGCDTSKTFTVNEPSVISLTATKTDESCFGCSDGSASALASGGNGGFSYSWSSGETTSDISNLNAGTYTICVTDVMGCDSCTSVLIDQLIGIEKDKIANNSFNAYPNPFNKQLSISYYSKEATTLIITVTDILGNKISTQEENLTAGKFITRINTSTLPPGIYLVTIQDNKRSFVKKAIKTN